MTVAVYTEQFSVCALYHSPTCTDLEENLSRLMLTLSYRQAPTQSRFQTPVQISYSDKECAFTALPLRLRRLRLEMFWLEL